MASDEQQIRHLLEWRRRVSGGDVEGLLTLAADHAVFLAPGHAPMTKADLAARFGRMAAKVRIEPVYQVKDVGISGDLAYVWSHVTAVFTAVWQVTRSAKLIPVVDNPDRL
jgi:ketosteroid isomerase-like protein